MPRYCKTWMAGTSPAMTIECRLPRTLRLLPPGEVHRAGAARRVRGEGERDPGPITTGLCGAKTVRQRELRTDSAEAAGGRPDRSGLSCCRPGHLRLGKIPPDVSQASLHIDHGASLPAGDRCGCRAALSGGRRAQL